MKRRRLKKPILTVPVAVPEVVHLPMYKCFVRIFESRLQISRATGIETLSDAKANDRRSESVKHPVGQDFLDQVNRALETEYTERYFQAEAWREKGKAPSFYLGNRVDAGIR